MQSVLLDLFPSKISLQNPDDAAAIVPELTAFWLLIQRESKQPHSKEILALLDDIEPSFPDAMNNPKSFSMDQSLLADRQAAGIDMSPPEEPMAYQKQHNQRIQAAGVAPGMLNLFQGGSLGDLQQELMSASILDGVPLEFVALMSQHSSLSRRCPWAISRLG